MMQKQNVLIIGIDGGTWRVLGPAIEQGHMPYLESLAASGARGILESTIPAITPAAWGTFQTGRNPGANGVYGFSYWDRQSKNYILVNSTNLQLTIWQILSRASRRVVSLNVPMTYPPQPVNGYVVSGIETPSLQSSFTYPAEFQQELLRYIPDYHILRLANIPKKGPRDERITPFVESLNKMASARANAACYLLDKGGWDLFMVHFQESDVLQHLLWKFLDPDHPDHDAAVRTYLFSAFYRHLDKQIERVCEKFKKDNQNCMTMIVSDHGFESHLRRFNLGNWLHQEGFLKLRQTVLKNFRIQHLIERTYSLLSTISPCKVKRELRKLLIAEHELVDWAQTKAFAVCSGGEGCIYLMEEDAAARMSTASRLKEKLSKITDPLNSRQIIRKVHLRDELYSGEKVQVMPDILIEPEDTYSCTGPYQVKTGLFTTVGSESSIQLGKHHKEGIIIAAGEAIEKNASLRLRLVDIVPTLLYYMGINSPVRLDGEICQTLFKQGFVKAIPVLQTIAQGNENRNPQRDVYKEEEKDLLQQRLKDLGYLD